MKFLDWYLKIAVGSALVGASMELFMIKTGFCVVGVVSYFFDGLVHKTTSCCTLTDDKVTILESEKRAWEASPEAQAVKEALNPWRKLDSEARKSS